MSDLFVGTLGLVLSQAPDWRRVSDQMQVIRLTAESCGDSHKAEVARFYETLSSEALRGRIQIWGGAK
jgi:hypothetical protein